MTPGSEAKELFRPRGGITLQAQPNSELSVAGQWFYAWQAARIPESGSYLTIQDALMKDATGMDLLTAGYILAGEGEIQTAMETGLAVNQEGAMTLYKDFNTLVASVASVPPGVNWKIVP